MSLSLTPSTSLSLTSPHALLLEILAPEAVLFERVSTVCQGARSLADGRDRGLFRDLEQLWSLCDEVQAFFERLPLDSLRRQALAWFEALCEAGHHAADSTDDLVDMLAVAGSSLAADADSAGATVPTPDFDVAAPALLEAPALSTPLAPAWA